MKLKEELELATKRIVNVLYPTPPESLAPKLPPAVAVVNVPLPTESPTLRDTNVEAFSTVPVT